MALREELEAAGSWLFRRRGYLPVFLFPVVVADLAGVRYPARGGAPGAWWDAACLLVSALGLGIRVATVGFAPGGTSGRNTGRQVAAVLNTTGLYSLTRHPLYLGNYLMWLGVAALPGVPWSPLVATLAFWLYYERIMYAEEEFLRRTFGAAYTDWADRTPAIVPRLSGWEPPALPFSLRTVLRREYPGWFALVASFTALHLAGSVVTTGRLALDPGWTAAFVATTVVCYALRTVKHRTRLLHVDGR
jgi:protein-S-isoprenylcysteine O-methyltransferase Ste14